MGGQLFDSLPCKGLRSRAPPAAEKARRSRCSGRRAQACFSARRAMRAPQTGRWLRRKAQTEGCIAALPHRYPVTPGRTLPCIRRGRCWHRPGSPVMPQTLSGGRKRPPYIAAGNGRRRGNGSQPPDPSAGRCNHRPVRRALPTRGNPAKGLRPRRYRTCRRHGNHHTSSLLPRALAGRLRGMVQPFSFRNCSINATSLSTPSGGMAL